MSRTLRFAQLTDVHLNAANSSWRLPGSLPERLFTRTVDELNAHDDLDFVLITGDVLNGGSADEVARFREIIGKLEKPWHFIPGNHDGFYDPNYPNPLPPQEAVSRIDPRMAQPEPIPQHARWSRTAADGVQLIGLESRIADDWNGVINAEQMDWLRGELAAHQGDDLIIVAVHHPLHNLTPLNEKEPWSNFICDNGPAVEALFDEVPAVKLVLSGHHHASQIVQRANGRLHVTTAPLTRYPCVWRDIRLTESGDSWSAHVETRSPATAGECWLALEKLKAGKTAKRYASDAQSAWAEFVRGRPEDRAFEVALG